MQCWPVGHKLLVSVENFLTGRINVELNTQSFAKVL